MFYKYPEEFIVPIVYDKDLKFESKDANRSEKLSENRENDLIDVDYISLKGSCQDEFILENTTSDNLEDEEVKDIINQIDNEYVSSEIGIV